MVVGYLCGPVLVPHESGSEPGATCNRSPTRTSLDETWLQLGDFASGYQSRVLCCDLNPRGDLGYSSLPRHGQTAYACEHLKLL